MFGIIFILIAGIPLIFLSLYQATLIANTVYAVEENGGTFTMRRYFFNALVLKAPINPKIIKRVRIFKSGSPGFEYACILITSAFRLVVLPEEVFNVNRSKILKHLINNKHKGSNKHKQQA